MFDTLKLKEKTIDQLKEMETLIQEELLGKEGVVIDFTKEELKTIEQIEKTVKNYNLIKGELTKTFNGYDICNRKQTLYKYVVDGEVLWTRTTAGFNGETEALDELHDLINLIATFK